MENNPEESFLQMQLDNDGRRILTDTVYWSRFLSIVGIVGLSIGLLAFALAGTALLAAFSKLAPGLESLEGFGSAIIIIVVLIIFGVFGFIVFMLYRFSVLTRKAIVHQDQAVLAEGMKCLKYFFVISGILAILGLLGNLATISTLFHS